MTDFPSDIDAEAEGRQQQAFIQIALELLIPTDLTTLHKVGEPATNATAPARAAGTSAST